jgi:uncharacterized protein
MDTTLLEKEKKLHELLRGYGRVAVAFSAGVDSTFLLKTAHDLLGDGVLALTARAVSCAEREIREAAAFCESLGVRHAFVDVDQMAVPLFADNPPDRCYHCKKALFAAILDAAKQAGFDCLAEGTNADDTHDYRPGLRALREMRVHSPLVEAGLGKQEIRRLSRDAGLPTWDKPSFACLATRIPYGEPITPEKLARIDKAEQFLQDHGFGQFRVRAHGTLARIEVEPAEFPRITDPLLAQTIRTRLLELGFDFVTLDLGGYASGSMNRTIV